MPKFRMVGAPKYSLPIFTLKRALGINIDEAGVDSVGGLILQQIGDIERRRTNVQSQLAVS